MLSGSSSGLAFDAYQGRISAGTAAVAQPATPAEQAAPTPKTEADKGALQLKSDPFAGVVIQFLNNKGDVAAQTPTAAALAYLRAGLTEDGHPKDDTLAAVV